MTQIIACSTREGIVLATDSRATWFDEAGEMRHFNLKKLLRLGSHSAMLSAGAGMGVEMSFAFQNFLQRQGVEVIDDIVTMALSFFTHQYGKWVEQRGMRHPSCPTADEGDEASVPLNEVYLILAGCSSKDLIQPYLLHLFSSEGERISIKPISTSQIIVVPRSLSVERRLEALRERDAPLDQFLSLSKSFLKKRSAEEEEVGPPFYFATITPDGYKEVVDEEVNG